MSVTIKAVQYDALRGNHLEVGQFTLIPADFFPVISAGTEVELSVDGLVCQPGDQLFVSPIDLTAGLVCKDADVDGVNSADVTLINVSTSNITDSTETAYDYQLYHYTTP
jgi:hypothetical protein